MHIKIVRLILPYGESAESVAKAHTGRVSAKAGGNNNRRRRPDSATLPMTNGKICVIGRELSDKCTTNW